MAIFERTKNQPAPVQEVFQPPKALPADGEEVPLGMDAGTVVYRDPAGRKLGGGPSEGMHYREQVAAQARLSVQEHAAIEAKALEAKAKARELAEQAKKAS